MIAYYTLIAIILIIATIAYSTIPIKNKRIFFITVSSALLILFMGLRNINVGEDNYETCLLYMKYGKTAINSLKEFANIPYVTYCKFLYLVSRGNILTFQITTSAITIICIAIYINKFSKIPVLSLLMYIELYFYCYSMNAIRQMLACSVVCLACCCWNDKKIKSGIALTIIACGIHATAIVSIPLAFLFNIKNIDRNVTKISIIALVGSILIEPFSRAFAYIYPHYRIYINNEGMSIQGKGKTVYLYIVLLALIIIGIVFIRHNKKQNIYNCVYVLIYISFIALIIGIINSKSVLALRVIYYYLISLICTIPNIIYYISSNTRNRVISSIIISTVMIIPFTYQLLGNYSSVVPYTLYKL